MIKTDAAVGQSPARAGRDPAIDQLKVPPRMMGRIIHEDQMGVTPQRLLQALEVKIGINIGIHNHKGRIAQQRQGLDDAARRLQRALPLVRILNLGGVTAPVAETGPDLPAQMTQVDHQPPDARADQRLDMIGDQRFAPDPEQRLRRVVGQGPKTLATARGQDHGPHDGRRAARPGRTRRSMISQSGRSSG